MAESDKSKVVMSGLMRDKEATFLDLLDKAANSTKTLSERLPNTTTGTVDSIPVRVYRGNTRFFDGDFNFIFAAISSDSSHPTSMPPFHPAWSRTYDMSFAVLTFKQNPAETGPSFRRHVVRPSEPSTTSAPAASTASGQTEVLQVRQFAYVPAKYANNLFPAESWEAFPDTFSHKGVKFTPMQGCDGALCSVAYPWKK